MSSALGATIEAAIDRDTRFRLHREPVKYLCCYRTLAGRVFAFERVTQKHVIFWMPADGAVVAVALSRGPDFTPSSPWSDPEQPDRYARISSLKSIPELRDAKLYRIPVTTVAQALAIAEALA